MITRLPGCFALLLALLLPFGADGANPLSYFLSLFSSSRSWDVNGDGAVRITLLAPEELGGGVNASFIASDLERIVAAETDLPVHVSHEKIECESVMGWFYDPRNEEARTGLTEGLVDVLLIAEKHAVVSRYPEFHFEGVRAVAGAMRGKSTSVLLLNTANPGRSFRDRSSSRLTDTAYRVGDGCGVGVVPVAPAWIATLKLNRLRGDSPVNARAYSFLAAACARFAFDEASKMKDDAFVSDWTTAPLLKELAASAAEAVAEERTVLHYKGPFKGGVRVESRNLRSFKVFAPSSNPEDPVRSRLEPLLKLASVNSVWRSPDDWYSNGSDFYDASFDLVFGDTIQIERLRNFERFTSFYLPPENFAAPLLAVYTPIPDMQPETIGETLEKSLFAGYDFACERKLRYIPLPLAVAKIVRGNPSFLQDGKIGEVTAQLLAGMLYTAVTGRCVQEAASGADAELRNLCAGVSYDVMASLSSLRNAGNAVVGEVANYVVEKGGSAVVGVRLLNRPDAPVRVLCATDAPRETLLSATELHFTPENYHLVQNVTVSAVTNNVEKDLLFIARAESEDPVINNQSDIRTLMLNYDKRKARSVRFSASRLPIDAQTRLLAEIAPAFPVYAKIVQSGFPAQIKIISSKDVDGVPVRFHPTAEDYEKGELMASVELSSDDSRFDGQKVQCKFTLHGSPRQLPKLENLEPEQRTVVGPAFVEVAAKWDSSSELLHTALFLNRRRIGIGNGASCSAAAETAAPPSRLMPGRYQFWTETITADLFPVASKVAELTVSEAQ